MKAGNDKKNENKVFAGAEKAKEQIPKEAVLDLEELDMVSGGGANNLEHPASCRGMM